MRATLTDIHTYPVKSCRGIRGESARLTETGLADDRHWMLVRPNGRFVTQRELPRMALVRPSLAGGVLELTAPGMPPLTISPGDRRERMQVVVWRDRCTAIDEGPRAADWLSAFLELPSRLVRMPDDEQRRVDPDYAGPNDQVGFADGFPFLLISRASLDDLNRRLSVPLPMNRFRPNIVVSGTDPFEEDRWKRIRVDGITFRVAKPCARCAITTTDQDTAERSHEPLRTLATFRHVAGRGVTFGQNLIHDRPGVLRVGAEVEVLEG